MSRLIRTLRSSAIRPFFSPTSSPVFAITSRHLSSTFDPSPSPPRLPADQQAEFERLQREAEARLSTHTSVPPASSPLQTSRHTTTPFKSSSQEAPYGSAAPASAQGVEEVTLASSAEEGEATGTGGTFSGGIRKGAPPEFEGDKNPKTGEVGGPKNEPLRWGAGGDYSFNGRVTDF